MLISAILHYFLCHIVCEFQIESNITSESRTSNKISTRLDALRERLKTVKRRYAENEVSVQRADAEATLSHNLAHKADKV